MSICIYLASSKIQANYEISLPMVLNSTDSLAKYMSSHEIRVPFIEPAAEYICNIGNA